MSQKSFIKGAMILGIAALVSKLLGGIYRIPYQNIVGNEGLALYNLVYPMYTTLLTVSTAGFPIAVSKFVSERLALNDTYGAQRIFRIAFMVMLVTGLVSFSGLYFGSDFLAKLVGDPGASLPIKSVSFALLIVPIIAVIRGYFQGWQEMMPTAVSQVFEQLLRVITILVLSYILIQQSVELAAAGAVFGAFTGAVLSLMILSYYYIRHRRAVTVKQRQSHVRYIPSQGIKQEPSLTLLKRMIFYALPICFGSLVLPLFNLADSYTVMNVLQWLGMENLDARYAFGVYSKGLPLVQLSAIFATALSLALVPSISEAKSLRQHATIQRRTVFALRLTLIIGLPAAMGLVMLAEPLNMTLFNERIGTDIIMVLAVATIFSTMEITTSGILQGVGDAMSPARNLFIGLLVKITLNIVLILFIGVKGAAVATIFAYMIALALNMRDLQRNIHIRYEWSKMLIRPLIATLIMAGAVYVTMIGSGAMVANMTHVRLEQAIITMAGVSVGVIVYGIALLLTKSLTVDELDMIPKVGSKIRKFVMRLGIYR